MAEERDDLVEGVLGGVGSFRERAERAWAQPLPGRAEHVVVGQEVLEARRLGRLGPSPDRPGIGAAVGLGEDDAHAHAPDAHPGGSSGLSPATIRRARSSNTATLSGCVST